MDMEKLKKRKKDLGLTNQEIADLSGVPLATVQKIFAGSTRSPRNDTISALVRVLFPEEHEDEENALRKQPDCIRKSMVTYGSGASTYFDYTYKDYIALPEEKRVELIDGRFYDMATPHSLHQIVIGQMYSQLAECAREHEECLVLLSPLDVMLDSDERTVVQPDIMILCDRTKMRKGRIFGAPDFIAEVASPGTRKMDYGKKAGKYIDAGVREYWIVDYERRIVMINDIEHECRHAIVPMEGEISLGISGGRCRIRFGEIAELLDTLGDI